jgi:Sec-independent protein translocase protein TatA
MAFGSELVLMVGLGFVVLGPKRMHALLGQVARVRSEIEKASRGLKTQLSAELHTPGSIDTVDKTTREAATCQEPANS